MPNFTRDRTMRLAALGLVAIVMASLSGCGSDFEKPKLGKVKGKVTNGGKPVEAGHIVFTPVAGKGGDTGQSATGEINPDGTYEITTFDTGDGAIVGQHVVTVEVRNKGDEMPKPKADGTIDYKLPKTVSPPKYAKVDTSPLRCTVEAGGKTFDIDLKD